MSFPMNPIPTPTPIYDFYILLSIIAYILIVLFLGLILNKLDEIAKNTKEKGKNE